MKLGIIASPHFAQVFAKVMKTPDIPVKTMFKLRTLSRILKKHQEDFQFARKSIIDQYSDKDESGKVKVENGMIHFSEENQDIVNEKFAEVANTEVELHDLPLNELGEKHGLTAEDITVLEFISEPIDPNTAEG